MLLVVEFAKVEEIGRMEKNIFMNRQAKYILLIVVCILLEISLIQFVPILEVYKHPLLSSLTCIETEDIRDLYWNINQIELSVSISETDGSMKITLSNNVPNFNVYLFRTNVNEKWKRETNGVLNLKLGDGENIVEIKATNEFGGETPETKYNIIKRNGSLKIIPETRKIIRGKYDFRFEYYGFPKIEWLRQYTLPIVADFDNQWEKYIAIGRWVREQIPFKDPVMKSRWDAQRILQAVWRDLTIGFMCDAYAATYVSACISAGLNARMMHLSSVEGNGHYATEIWSDDYNKWIFMDPLFGCCFIMAGIPLSTVELHNLWKDKRLEDVEKRYYDETARVSFDTSKKEYFNLFHDIQLVNSNDFLSNPLDSAFDLITLKVRYMRWIDESNPKYNRILLATKLILFYYSPKISKKFIIPLLIPFLLLLFSILLVKDIYKQSSYGRG
jgi:hypothetical protein